MERTQGDITHRVSTRLVGGEDYETVFLGEVVRDVDGTAEVLYTARYAPCIDTRQLSPVRLVSETGDATYRHTLLFLAGKEWSRWWYANARFFSIGLLPGMASAPEEDPDATEPTLVPEAFATYDKGKWYVKAILGEDTATFEVTKSGLKAVKATLWDRRSAPRLEAEAANLWKDCSGEDVKILTDIQTLMKQNTLPVQPPQRSRVLSAGSFAPGGLRGRKLKTPE